MSIRHIDPARCLFAAAALAALSAGGCMDRRIIITSEPSGALVHLNDAEVGRTPVQTRFLWYGTYDVRLSLDGYEPVTAGREAGMPIYEIPPLDLPASALPIRTNIRWHFDLEPSPPATVETRDEVIRRARELRLRLD